MGRPPSLFSDSIEELRVRRVEFVCSLFGGVGKKPDRMDAHIERFRRMARTPAGIPIKVDERAEAAGLAANDRNHQGNSKRAGPGKGVRSTSNADPDGQRILHRAGMDTLPRKCGPMFSRPINVGSLADFEKKIEFLGKERVVVV